MLQKKTVHITGAAARVMGQSCPPSQFRPFTTSSPESHNHSVSMITTIIPIPDGEVEAWEAEVAGHWGSLNPKFGSLASDPLTPPLLLSSVTKICAQCEMEHSADGLMEQMCSSDFGECRAHVATALSLEKCTFFFFFASQGLQKPLKAMVHPWPGFLQPFLDTAYRGASRAGFSLWEAGLVQRWVGAAEGRDGLQDGNAAPWSPGTSA